MSNANSNLPHTINPNLPGSEIVVKGMSDLGRNLVTIESLALLICRPEMLRIGIYFPDMSSISRPRELELYTLIENESGRDSHTRYNAILRRLVSFIRCSGR